MSPLSSPPAPSVVTPGFFAFFGLSNMGAIDNIVVSDTVDIEPPAIPFYMQTWFLPIVGAVIVIVAAVIVIVLRHKKIRESK